MENVYTEAMLKPLKKADLYEILLARGIEVNKNTANEEMIAMILANNPPAPLATGGGDKPPDSLTPPAPLATDDSLPKYTPDQLIKSSTYSHRRDVLRALLDNKGMYSHADIAKILKEFFDSEVK